MALIYTARDCASISLAMTMFSTFTAGTVSGTALFAFTASIRSRSRDSIFSVERSPMKPDITSIMPAFSLADISDHRVSSGRMASAPASPTPCSPAALARMVGLSKIPPSAFQETDSFGSLIPQPMSFQVTLMRGSLNSGSFHWKLNRPLK